MLTINQARVVVAKEISVDEKTWEVTFCAGRDT